MSSRPAVVTKFISPAEVQADIRNAGAKQSKRVRTKSIPNDFPNFRIRIYHSDP